MTRPRRGDGVHHTATWNDLNSPAQAANAEQPQQATPAESGRLRIQTADGGRIPRELPEAWTRSAASHSVRGTIADNTDQTTNPQPQAPSSGRTWRPKPRSTRKRHANGTSSLIVFGIEPINDLANLNREAAYLRDHRLRAPASMNGPLTASQFGRGRIMR